MKYLVFSFFLLTCLSSHAQAQFYASFKGYDTQLNGGGRIGDSTSVFQENQFSVNVGLRAGFRISKGKSFFDLGAELNEYHTSFGVEDSTLNNGIWHYRFASVVINGFKVGLELSAGTFFGETKLYGAASINPGFLFFKPGVIDQIESSNYSSQFSIDSSVKMGKKIGTKFDLGFFYSFSYNDTIKYESDLGNFSFKTRQIGLILTYIVAKKDQQ